MNHIINAFLGLIGGVVFAGLIYLIISFAELQFVDPNWPVIRLFVGVAALGGLFAGAIVDE